MKCSEKKEIVKQKINSIEEQQEKIQRDIKKRLDKNENDNALDSMMYMEFDSLREKHNNYKDIINSYEQQQDILNNIHKKRIEGKEELLQYLKKQNQQKEMNVEELYCQLNKLEEEQKDE